jgi:hypothetical protein
LSGILSRLNLNAPYGGNPFARPGTTSPGILPFDAGPQFAPQGIFGGLLGSALGGLGGGALGGLLGNRNVGTNIGRAAGGALGAILPFEAGPQFVPQGWLGNILGQQSLASTISPTIGPNNLGRTIGSVPPQFTTMLPFDAGPQFAPQGFLGGALGSVLGGLGGGALGGLLGNRNVGTNIGRVAGGALGAILPFDAGPQFVPYGLANVPIASIYPGAFYR